MTGKNKWTKAEDALIVKHYKYNITQLYKLLPGRTDNSIQMRASRLGQHRRLWRPEEDDVIIKCYAQYGSVYCITKLKGRTEVAIQSRALKLNVKRDLSKRRNGLPNGDVIETESLAYNKSWKKK